MWERSLYMYLTSVGRAQDSPPGAVGSAGGYHPPVTEVQPA